MLRAPESASQSRRRRRAVWGRTSPSIDRIISSGGVGHVRGVWGSEAQSPTRPGSAQPSLDGRGPGRQVRLGASGAGRSRAPGAFTDRSRSDE